MGKFAGLNNIEAIALESFKETLIKKYREKISLIELFGSKARGDFDKDSDIDLLVIIKKKNQKLIDYIYDTVIDVDINYSLDISLKIFSQAEYERLDTLKTPFIQNITREGVPLWKAD